MKLVALSNLLSRTTLALLVCHGPILLAEEERHEQLVRDLAYGTSLFHFFQHKNLSAITDIEVAKEKNTLQHQYDDAELLLGGLYFDYGLANDAEDIFVNLLNEDISNETQDRIWFNLARVQYEQNKVDQTEQLLSRISGTLPEQREAQKQHILTNLYTQNQQYDQAMEAVRKISNDHIWHAYSQYNLGVSLISSENDQSGTQWLKPIIGQESEDEERLALKDSTLFALGMNALKQENNDEAIDYFSRIRLSGPLTNKALLGSGWAWIRKSDPDKALTYWLALRDKQQVDRASYEALLAIAYAFEQKRNKALATQYYEQAAQQFDHILVELDEVISQINNHELLFALHNNQLVEDQLRDIFDQQPPQSSATAYLFEMFASKSFQLEIQRYQELLNIKSRLTDWQRNLPAFDLMLKERRQAFENKKPMVEQTTSFEQLDAIKTQRDSLALEAQRIEESEDFLALANEDETDYLEQFDEIESSFKRLKGQQDLTEEQDKYRLLKGLLYYQIQTDFPRRMWRVKREVQLLDRALEQAQLFAQSLKQAASLNDARLDDFDLRIQGQDQHINQLYDKTVALIAEQEKHINRLAINAIEARKQHLAQLRLSARYSAARLYDELSTDNRGEQ